MGRGRPRKCPYCGATKSVAKGFRYNKTGTVKLRRCKACNRRWTTGPGTAEDACFAQDVASQKHTDAQSASVMKETASAEAKPFNEQESVELSLGGGVRPSQEDPGAEEKTEKN